MEQQQNSYTVPETMRLDQCVAMAWQISRSRAAEQIKHGAISINEKKTRKPALKVKKGDLIHMLYQEEQIPSRTLLQYVARETKQNTKRDFSFPVLYEDAFCLVLNKPAGITVHPGTGTKGEQTLIELLRAERHDPDLHLVHRLDKETTGCLLVAKGQDALAILQKQFKDRTIKKQYFAIVYGVPKDKTARIDAPIGRSLLNRTRMSLFRTGKSREAQTTYEIISAKETISLLRLTLHTGRTHQIRVHLAGIGHPILGDATYGTQNSQKFSQENGIKGILLHATSLTFQSIATKEEIAITAPQTEFFQKTLQNLHLGFPK